MASFEVKVYRIQVEEHPNADALELARVGGYVSLIKKESFSTGDLAAYIPEASIVPEDVIQELGLEGRLAGKAKNRVKAIKLRGILSQGLVYPVAGNRLRGISVNEGDDVMEALGVEQWEPPIPVHLSGKVQNSRGATLHFDIEDIKKHPEVFKAEEEVEVTEKIHGTWCCLGWNRERGPIVSSKGLSSQGLSFKVEDPDNADNLYVRMWNKYGDVVEQRAEHCGQSVYVLGEIFGRSVQDLQYGEKAQAFAVFDVYVGDPGSGRYLPWSEVLEFIGEDFQVVPTLYRGPFDESLLSKWTSGKTLWGEGVDQMREGVVIRDCAEGSDMEVGRRVLKSVSEGYLLRKGGTEFN